MLEAEGVQPILDRAADLEREFDWLGASQSYKKVLTLIAGQDTSKKGEIHECLGYALHRASMQSEANEEFRNRTMEAVSSYEMAAESYGNANQTGRNLRCRAFTAYLGFWLAADVTDKKKLLDESWRLTGEALKAFGEVANFPEFGVTFNRLSTSVPLAFSLEWNLEARKRVMREAVDLGEQAIKLVSSIGNPGELATCFVRTARFLGCFGAAFHDLEEREAYLEKAQGYWRRAIEVSEETAMHELANDFPLSEVPTDWSFDKGEQWCQAELEYRKKTRDKFVIGSLLDWLAMGYSFKAYTAEDPDEGLKLTNMSLQYAEEAGDEYSTISFVSPRQGTIWVGAPHAEYYWKVALQQIDFERKQSLLRKAIELSPDMLKRAEKSGYPGSIADSHHVFSKILAALATTETLPEKKRQLLEKALEHRNESIKINDQLGPFDYWNRGVLQNYLSDIKSELAKLSESSKTRRHLFEEAIQYKENGVELCKKQAQFWEKTAPAGPNRALIGRWQYECGDLLSAVHEIDSQKEGLRRAAQAFEEAADSFQRLDLPSRTAECYWRAGQTYDRLDEYLKAAEAFTLASNGFQRATKKLPQLDDFYMEQALYMSAWNEIERARHSHARQEYSLAKEHYEKASALHKSTKQWSYLTGNYSAWAQVEKAEDLSRRELSQEAIEAFREGTRLFADGKSALEAELGEIENLEEKRMVTKLIKASDLRQRYCVARTVIEEARILYGKGDYYTSVEKYGNASETFERIAEEVESEQTRRELKLIMILAKAWQMMARAEEETSPRLYLEASRLFEEARELSPNEKARSLALGHSRFCMALECGTRFADSRESALHTSAIQNLESAANFYMKAGFQNASEYAEASKLLFDAYAYIDRANKEGDAEKKAKLYVMTQKVLEASADSYGRSGQAAKREQVLRQLEKVKKNRELAMSLIQVLQAPAILSTTEAFSMPSPTHEVAIGLERFEHADIQANLIARQKNLKVGEDLDLEVELVNAGRSPAQLIKVENLIPEGFDLKTKPEAYRVEDSFLNMKGKQLSPLKTEEVKLVLRPRSQGEFTFRPRVLYLDESGKYKSHEPEPIKITVKQLGLSGWVRGP